MAHLFGFVLGVAVAAVVVHFAVDGGRHYARRVAEALAHVEHVPVGIAFVEEAYLHLGFESAVAHRLSAYVVDYPETVHAVCESGLLQCREVLPEFLGEHFVGIDAQHIVAGGQCGCVLPLRAVACKWAHGNLCAIAAADVDGGVVAAGVHHHDFVGDAYERVEASLDIGSLVAGDNSC